MLQNESGIPLEDRQVAEFKDAIVNGDWVQAEALAPAIQSSEKTFHVTHLAS